MDKLLSVLIDKYGYDYATAKKLAQRSDINEILSFLNRGYDKGKRDGLNYFGNGGSYQ